MELVHDGRGRGRHDGASHDGSELHQHDRAQDPVTAIRWDLVGDGRLGPRGGCRAGFGGAQVIKSIVFRGA